MPAFLEAALKREYAGQDPSIPFRIMQSKGLIRGQKETAKGAELDAKHAADAKRKGQKKALKEL